MFKSKGICKFAGLSLTVALASLISGCANMGYHPTDNSSANMSASNSDRYYYRDNDGRYYYRDNLGNHYRTASYPNIDHHYQYVNGIYVDNSALANRVRASLAQDSNLNNTNITVRNYEGRVELSGSVNNQQKQEALTIARRVPGVVLVVDNLQTRMF